ncbi:ATP-binding protein [Roseobacteraceae bacterium S113]
MFNFTSILSTKGLSNSDGTSGWAKVLQKLPCWLWETDDDYRLTYVGEGLELHSKLKRKDLLGVYILSDKYGTAEEEAGLQDYQDALRAREPINGMVYEKLLLNGERTVFLDAAIPLTDHLGRFRGYRGITFHLSQAMVSAGKNAGIVADLKWREAELEAMLQQRNAELEHSNGVMADILNAMGEGLLVTSGERIYDEDNRILFVNPAFLQQFGVSDDLLYPGRTFRTMIDLMVARGDAERGGVATITEALNAQGGLKFALKSLDRIIEVKGAKRPGGGYVLVHTDVTHAERHTQMLERARVEADIANAAKSNFLAAMSHEIRTPMNGIVGMTDLLADTGLDEEQSECLDTIRGSALALTSLISDILDFSKIEAGHLEIYAEPFAIADLCRDVAALIRPMAEAKGLEFVFELATGLPVVLVGDNARIRQVLLNLLGNAVKFTLDGTVRLAVRYNEGLHITISDSGIGIPEDKVDRIFLPFEQVQGGLQRSFEGTGLGLAITNQLVDGMDGRIDVSSTVGKGTDFELFVPLTIGAQSDLPGQSATGAVCAETFEGRHVLVAEDNRTNQLVVRKMLTKMGADITLVCDGAAAVEACAGQRFDLVLMDLSMPLMSGLEATRRIRSREALEPRRDPVPIVALTGNAFEKDQKDAAAAGMNDFLSKPVRYVELRDCVARLVSKSAQH